MKFLISSKAFPNLWDGVNKDSLDLNNIFLIAGNVVRLLLWFAGVAAIAVIIIAGIMYATSTGDPAKLQKAKGAIVNTVIGLILVASAYSVITLIVGRVVG